MTHSVPQGSSPRGVLSGLKRVKTPARAVAAPGPGRCSPSASRGCCQTGAELEPQTVGPRDLREERQ